MEIHMKRLMIDAVEVLNTVDSILLHMPEHIGPNLEAYRAKLGEQIGRLAQEELNQAPLQSMTAKEFRAARQALGLSQSQLGKVLNTHSRTIRKWERDDGTRPPNPIACRVIEWMLAGYMPPVGEKR